MQRFQGARVCFYDVHVAHGALVDVAGVASERAGVVVCRRVLVLRCLSFVLCLFTRWFVLS